MLIYVCTPFSCYSCRQLRINQSSTTVNSTSLLRLSVQNWPSDATLWKHLIYHAVQSWARSTCETKSSCTKRYDECTWGERWKHTTNIECRRIGQYIRVSWEGTRRVANGLVLTSRFSNQSWLMHGWRRLSHLAMCCSNWVYWSQRGPRIVLDWCLDVTLRYWISWVFCSVSAAAW
jgi:hypothetical protein